MATPWPLLTWRGSTSDLGCLKWQKVGLDGVYMPPREGYRFLMVAQCDLSGWVGLNPSAPYLLERLPIFCGKMWYFDISVSANCLLIEDLNTEAVAELAERYGVKRVVVSAYHPQANDMIKRGRKPVIDALPKMSDGGSTNWVRNLPAAVWADWSTVRASTGFTTYYISCGNEPVLPIELEVPTWRILPWDDIYTTSDLLASAEMKI